VSSRRARVVIIMWLMQVQHAPHHIARPSASSPPPLSPWVLVRDDRKKGSGVRRVLRGVGSALGVAAMQGQRLARVGFVWLLGCNSHTASCIGLTAIPAGPSMACGG
jgi:hypothetical protein